MLRFVTPHHIVIAALLIRWWRHHVCRLRPDYAFGGRLATLWRDATLANTARHQSVISRYMFCPLGVLPVIVCYTHNHCSVVVAGVSMSTFGEMTRLALYGIGNATTTSTPVNILAQHEWRDFGDTVIMPASH